MYGGYAKVVEPRGKIKGMSYKTVVFLGHLEP